MTMGPEVGTEKYNKQVEDIVKFVGSSDLTEQEIDQAMLLYVMDPSYSRPAILEARKKILEKNKDT